MRYVFFVLAILCATPVSAQYYSNDNGQAAMMQQDREMRQQREMNYQQDQMQSQIKSQQMQIDRQQQDINNFNSASPIERMRGGY